MIMEGAGADDDDDDDEGPASGKVGDGDGDGNGIGIPAAAASFVASMTFATGGGEPGGFGGRSCDCDECDCVRRRGSRRTHDEEEEEGYDDGNDSDGPTMNRSFVPEPIRKAIELHKQSKKRLRLTLPPTRTLLGRHYCVCRDDDDDDAGSDGKAAATSTQEETPVVSAWEWELPYRSEPSLEFGTSHRLVWVRRCPGMIQSIASSTATSIVVGSSEEEASRVLLEDWTEGSVAFVPSNGGRAVGYVHASGPSPTRTTPAKNPRGTTADRNTTDQEDLDDDEEEWEQLNRNDEVPPGGLYATLLVVKLPDRVLVSDRQVTLLEQKDETAGPPTQQQPLPSWLAPLIPICQRLLLPQDEPPPSNGGVGAPGMKPKYTILKSEDAHVVKAALSSLLLRDEKASR